LKKDAVKVEAQEESDSEMQEEGEEELSATD
jgi:hypothetical protein